MQEARRFDFAEDAYAAFVFLNEYGFSCVSTSSNGVRYESEWVYLEIAYEERDGEVFVSFGRTSQNEKFSFTLFLRLVNSDLDKQLGERLADSPEAIRESLTKLAEALKTEGQPIIDGDDAVFDRMKSVRWWDFRPDALRE
jgi:hypothetical protein